MPSLVNMVESILSGSVQCVQIEFADPFEPFAPDLKSWGNFLCLRVTCCRHAIPAPSAGFPCRSNPCVRRDDGLCGCKHVRFPDACTHQLRYGESCNSKIQPISLSGRTMVLVISVLTGNIVPMNSSFNSDSRWSHMRAPTAADLALLARKVGKPCQCRCAT